jgi:hypothetical protein
VNAEHQHALLRRFEPTLRFTQGEVFFPAAVEPYIHTCSLWVQPSDGDPRRLIPRGELTLQHLAKPRMDEFGTIYFLRLTQPMAPPEMAAYNLQLLRGADQQPRFRIGRGRLARVGYASRVVDALYSTLSLLRGRVPGDAALAAQEVYRQAVDADAAPYTYFGRVVKQNDWLVLQYWFFYFYNNWRSGYFGANDHEADWEMISVYLSKPEDGKANPEWVAYASHDFNGDDLRRRWDDPELEKDGDHPIVYVGAGSHASYFSAGEYLTELEIPFLAPINRITRRLREFWGDTLRQYGDPDTPPPQNAPGVFRIPFVDYARGDGRSVGPGQQHQWASPVLLEPTPTWVRFYRGLWGLFSNDPFNGENAPAGPMYNRDGSVRRSWYDPVGWAGMDKVTPAPEALELVRQRQADLAAHKQALQKSIQAKSQELKGIGVEMEAMHNRPHLDDMHRSHLQRAESAAQELQELRSQMADGEALAQALHFYENRMQGGEKLPARAHIRHAFRPTTSVQLRFGRLAETWAAISVGILLIGSVLLVWLAREYFTYWLLSGLAVLFFLEAAFRGHLTRLITNITVALAIASTVLLVYEFFWYILAFLVLATGVYILVDNLRELRM